MTSTASWRLFDACLLCSTLNETPIVADKPTPVVQTATAALAEIMASAAAKPYIAEAYCPLLASLLMRCGTAHGVDKGISST